jgi:hypothetical protein
MIKKSNSITFDLKKSQLELLKINSKLRNIDIENEKLFLRESQQILDELKPIKTYFDKIEKYSNKMKTQIKPIKEETSLFENSEEVIKLLNKDDFNKYDFSYKKLQTIIPLFKSIKFEPKIEDTVNYETQNFDKLSAYLDEKPFISNLEETLEKKIKEIKKIKKFIKKNITKHLDIKKIEEAVQIIEIIDDNDIKNKQISKDPLQLSELSIIWRNINDIITIIKSNKENIISLNIEDLRKLVAPLKLVGPFKLEGGGNISNYLDNISKTKLITNFQKSKILDEILTSINKSYRILKTQYVNYTLFLENEVEETKKITVLLSLKEIFDYYKKFNIKYNIINPKEKINDDLNTKERKNMYTIHYFQIYIIYHFLKFLIIKIIFDLKKTLIKFNDNIDEYEDLFIDSKFIYFFNNYKNDENKENKKMLQFLIMLLNLTKIIII